MALCCSMSGDTTLSSYSKSRFYTKIAQENPVSVIQNKICLIRSNNIRNNLTGLLNWRVIKLNQINSLKNNLTSHKFTKLLKIRKNILLFMFNLHGLRLLMLTASDL